MSFVTLTSDLRGWGPDAGGAIPVIRGLDPAVLSGAAGDRGLNSFSDGRRAHPSSLCRDASERPGRTGGIASGLVTLGRCGQGSPVRGPEAPAPTPHPAWAPPPSWLSCVLVR